MMMGRIPILIKTDSVFPFEEKYNLNDVGIVIEESDLTKQKVNLIELVENYYEKNKLHLLDIQQNNRNIWEKYYSTSGFLNNITI
jgi:hypothetical protein